MGSDPGMDGLPQPPPPRTIFEGPRGLSSCLTFLLVYLFRNFEHIQPDVTCSQPSSCLRSGMLIGPQD